MRIAITDPGDTFLAVRKKLAALPPGCQADVYGDGMIAAARKVAQKAKRLAPVGKREPLTSKSKPRRRLKQSIRAVRVSWHYGGEKIKRSAAIVLTEQPHAHLVEKGTRHSRANPFLETALKDSASLLSAFRVGSAKSFDRLVRRLETGKLRARERRAFRP